MTELEKMQRAKMYIDKMANGINPIDDTAAPEMSLTMFAFQDAFSMFPTYCGK